MKLIKVFFIFSFLVNIYGADGDVTVMPIDPPRILAFSYNWRLDFAQLYNKNGLGALTFSGNTNNGCLDWKFHRLILNYESSEYGMIILKNNEFDVINEIVKDIVLRPIENKKMGESGFQFVWEIDGKTHFRSIGIFDEADDRIVKLVSIVLFKYANK